MNFWNQAPLVRLLFPFIAGILTAVYLPYHIENYFLIILPYVAILAAIVFIPPFRITYKRSWIFGLITYLLLFLTGYQLTIYKTEKFNKHHFSKYVNGKSSVVGYVLQSPIEKDRTYKMVYEITGVKYKGEWVGCEGKAMIYLKKDSNSASLKYGDEFILNGTFNDIPSAGNPGEFNYQRFLAFHNIFQQCSADEKSWMPTGKNAGNIILQYSYTLRDRLLKVLRDYSIKGDEYAVGAALMLGYSDKLDAEIISAYSSTGALHVLSVSGLHVAIVYVVFNWLLFFLDKIKYGNVIKAVVLILLLWFYSALTGLSPSVLRAATMFSFIIIAKAFNRYTNIYNTLAASAFLLLAINPYLIMEVGFQLSYIAVVGIVFIQPKIYQWFEPKSWLMDQIWTITAVSIAAQIATFPLGLHYFHQFPNYFLLSNFIVIPVSTVIIYLGIALFAFAKMSLIATYIAIAFNWCVWLLNESVKLIEKWPHAILEGISISIFETWMLYGMIILFLYYFINRRIRFLYLALCSVILILFSQIIEQSLQFHQHKFIVYNIPKTTAIDLISSRHNTLFTDSSLANNNSALLFHIKHNWWDLGMEKSSIITGNSSSSEVLISNNIIEFNDKKIIVVKEKMRNTNQNGKPLKIDYLILSKNAKMSIAEVMKTFAPKEIIFDSSNSNYKLVKWKAECDSVSVPYFSVSDSGAFIADL